MGEDEFIDFGNGLSQRVKGSGWSFQENGFTWTTGDVAILKLPARPAGEAGRLMIALHPLTYPALRAQRVGVSVAERHLADLVASDECVVEVEIPSGLASAGETVSVELHLPDATSPNQAGFGNDDRKLGVAVKWVRWSGPQGEAVEHVGPRTVLLVRGHQVSALTAIFNGLECLREQFSMVACGPHVEQVRHAVLGLPQGSLAAVWLQRTPEGPSPESLREMVGETPIVCFPHLSMELLWPYAGPDPRLKAEPPLYPHGRYPFSDAVAAQVAAEGIAADETVLARYMTLSDAALPDFSAALGEFAAVLRARDEDCTIKLAGFVLGQFQSVRLFHNPHAPTGALLAHLACLLAVHGGATPDEVLGATLLELNRLISGYLGLWYEQVPVHPAVAAGYQLRWHRSATRYRWHENEWSFEDYTLNYIRWAPWTV